MNIQRRITTLDDNFTTDRIDFAFLSKVKLKISRQKFNPIPSLPPFQEKKNRRNEGNPRRKTENFAGWSFPGQLLVN